MALRSAEHAVSHLRPPPPKCEERIVKRTARFGEGFRTAIRIGACMSSGACRHDPLSPVVTAFCCQAFEFLFRHLWNVAALYRTASVSNRCLHPYLQLAPGSRPPIGRRRRPCRISKSTYSAPYHPERRRRAKSRRRRRRRNHPSCHGCRTSNSWCSCLAR